MEYEPAVDHADLIATMHDLYRLPATRLAFVPVGYAAACYRLDCADGTRYFLKVWPDTQAGRVNAARRDIFLPLARALYDRDLYRRVPYPLPTQDGAWWATFADQPFAVFPFLPGHPPPAELPPTLRDELARTIATIH